MVQHGHSKTKHGNNDRQQAIRQITFPGGMGSDNRQGLVELNSCGSGALWTLDDPSSSVRSDALLCKGFWTYGHGSDLLAPGKLIYACSGLVLEHMWNSWLASSVSALLSPCFCKTPIARIGPFQPSASNRPTPRQLPRPQNFEKWCAKCSKSQSAIARIAVSGSSNPTFKSRNLWFEPLFKSPLELQHQFLVQQVRTMSFSEKAHTVSNRWWFAICNSNHNRNRDQLARFGALRWWGSGCQGRRGGGCPREWWSSGTGGIWRSFGPAMNALSNGRDTTKTRSRHHRSGGVTSWACTQNKDNCTNWQIMSTRDRDNKKESKRQRTRIGSIKRAHFQKAFGYKPHWSAF